MEQFNKKPKERRKIVSIVIFLIIFSALIYFLGGQFGWW